jgi:carbamoyltransferase
MHILGINSAYHESAAVVVADGTLRSFVEEERVSRRKHAKEARIDNAHELPVGAIELALRQAGTTFDEIDLIGYSFAQAGRRQNIGVDRYLAPGGWGTEEGETAFHASLAQVPGELQKLGKRSVRERLRWVPHHVAHAASAYLCSPFAEAAVLAIDGIGEFDSLLAAYGRGSRLEPLFSFPYPHSLGFLWERICTFLGFSEYDACKVMGLASYGDARRFRQAFSRVAQTTPSDLLVVDLELARFRSPDHGSLETLFGPARRAGEPLEARHADVAAAVQDFTERCLLQTAIRVRRQTGARALCLSGGVALNCVANSRLEREAGFAELWVQPAANDAGTALGAALHLWCEELGQPRRFVMDHAYWGPTFDAQAIAAAVAAGGWRSARVADPAREAAQRVAAGKVVGWFQGAMEAGPRALGNRSLLADPRRPDIREVLNRKVKHREEFRPFAPSVLAEHVDDWFIRPPVRSVAAEFMLMAYPVRPALRARIPGVIHVDGTSRIQAVSATTNPRYHALISAFHELTGVPLVLNTSFNDSEPIVLSPADALATFSKTGIDAVILDDVLVEK